MKRRVWSSHAKDRLPSIRKLKAVVAGIGETPYNANARINSSPEKYGRCLISLVGMSMNGGRISATVESAR